MNNTLQISGCKAGFCGGMKAVGIPAIAVVGLIALSAIAYRYHYLNQKQLC